MKKANEQLVYELDFYGLKKHSISSLFIGGGTPSCVKAKHYEEFFKIISPYLSQNAEITSEANPNSASFEWLYEMKNFGLNRISFGVQSFVDEKLKLLGRNHSKTQAIKAIENAKKAGFENISLDYMYATSCDDEKSVKNELEFALTLPINHISAYSLTLEENTPFYTTPHVQNDDENVAKIVANTLNKNGLTQYEVSNYGKPCRHNVGYWQHKPYLGIGAGAVGYMKDFRYYPNKNVKEYIENPLQIKKEFLSTDDLYVEKLFLGFRSHVGVAKNLLNDEKKIKILLDEKKIILKNERYYCLDYFLADEIVLFLLS